MDPAETPADVGGCSGGGLSPVSTKTRSATTTRTATTSTSFSRASATSPLRIRFQQIAAAQTGFFHEAEALDGTGESTTINQDGNYFRFEAVKLSVGADRELDVQTDCVIPRGEAVAGSVIATPQTSTSGLDITLDIDSGGAVTLESVGSGVLQQSTDQFDLYRV